MTDDVDAVARAARRLAEAERELGEAVARARADGATWQQVADVLGVTRQAAFKRFGHAVDPVTGEELVPAPTADVEELAREAFQHLAAGNSRWVRERMTQACARQLSRRAIERVWRGVVADFGQLEEIEASSHDPQGGPLPSGAVPLPAVARLDLRHEAGDLWAHVVVNRDGKVSGMVMRPGGVPETWPL